MRKFRTIFLLCIVFCSNYAVASQNLKQYKALMLIPEGFHDIEFATIAEFFQSANIRITTVGVGGLKVKSIAGLQITTNKRLEDVNYHSYDVVILLGASTANYYNTYPIVENILKMFDQSNKIIGATGLAPFFIDRIGLSDKRNITVDASVSGRLSQNCIYVANKTVMDGNLVTSFSPKDVANFASLIISSFQGQELATQIRSNWTTN